MNLGALLLLLVQGGKSEEGLTAASAPLATSISSDRLLIFSILSPWLQPGKRLLSAAFSACRIMSSLTDVQIQNPSWSQIIETAKHRC